MTATEPDPGFRDQLAQAILRPGLGPHDGLGWEQPAVDALLRLVEARVEAAANQRGAEELDAMAVAFYADARHLDSTGESAYRHAANDCRERARVDAQPVPGGGRQPMAGLLTLSVHVLRCS